MNRFRLMANNAHWGEFIEFMFFERLDGNRTAIGTSIIMEAKPDSEWGGTYQEPTFRLDRTAAQELMDGLWQCGLRPSEGTGSAGQLAATQKHLEDMRTIAFKYIENKS